MIFLAGVAVFAVSVACGIHDCGKTYQTAAERKGAWDLGCVIGAIVMAVGVPASFFGI